MSGALDPRVVKRLQRLAGRNPETLEAGGTLGRYRILRELGRGAMGAVYEAEDPELHRRVAVKVLNPAADTEHGQERFQREARAAAAIVHPHLVKLYDVDEADGRAFLVLEMVGGRSLRKIIDDPAVPLEKKLRLLADAARGVGAAHASGIIHRDLKPENILVTPDDVAKVVDFGLAAGIERLETLTQSGVMIGTPHYMSPEQASGRLREIGPASDVYAFGIILFEILTGDVPYRGHDVKEVVARIVGPETPLPSSRRKGIPFAVENICRKALDKEPGRRYPDADAFADDLDRYLKGEPVQARPSPRDSSRRGILVLAAVVIAIGATVALVRPSPKAPNIQPPLANGRAHWLAWLQSVRFEPFDDAGVLGWRPLVEDVGRRRSARKNVDEALKLPGAGQVLSVKSLAAAVDAADRMMAGREDEAIAGLALIRESFSRSEADLFEALASWQGRRFDECSMAARRLEHGAELCARAEWLKGLRRVERGEHPINAFDEAAAFAEKSGNVGLLCLIRKSQAELGGPEAAGRFVQALAMNVPPLLRGSVRLAQGDAVSIGSALADFEKAAIESPQSPWPWILRARAVRKITTDDLLSGEARPMRPFPIEEGFKAADQALQLDATNAEAFYERGQLFLVKALTVKAERGNLDPVYEAAVRDFKAAADRKPATAAYWCSLGEAWRKRAAVSDEKEAARSLVEALQAYEEAVRRHPDYGTTHHGLAATREQRSELPGVEPADALKWLGLAGESATAAIRCIPTAGGYYFRRGAIRMSIAALLRKTNADPIAKLDEAAADFRAALERNPAMVNARSNLATTLSRKAESLNVAGRDPHPTLDESIREWSEVIKADPTDAEARFQVPYILLNGAVWRNPSDPARAQDLEAARTGFQSLPATYRVLRHLGVCLAELGRREEAIAVFEKAQGLRSPTDADLGPAIEQLKGR